ncbi:MAG TPA: amino acid adenylation domain-containing protein, partial [Aquabacterium sp.]|nr:amino acid adenylation domain-containing protein [Aquabacterium sp.]HQC98339.1 amino acid adenylation domain-containing protein [Aquabacterium sp.]
FSALLNYRHSPGLAEADGQAAAAVPAFGLHDLGGSERTNYPFGMSVDDLGQGFALHAQVDRSVNPDRVCLFMLAAIEAVVQALADAPATPLAQLDVLPDAERTLVLQAFNPVPRAWPQAALMHQLFEAQAAAQGQAVALVHDEQSLSYAELNHRANRLAHHLIGLGVGLDQRVAICLPRGFDMVVAVLATLKAGAAYVPLDAAYPAERLAYMLRDSTPAALLTHGTLAGRLPAHALGIQAVLLDADAGLQHLPAHNPDSAQLGLTEHHLAYVIYTSGSTGEPKGVMNEHAGLRNLVHAQCEVYGVTADSRVLQFVSLSFDVSISEIAMALCHGATLVLASPEQLLPGEPLLVTLRRHRISHLSLPVAVMAALPADADLAPLQTLIVGGEAMPATLAARGAQQQAVFNSYGPTEAAVCNTVWRCRPGHAGAVPIGRPLANNRLYILDGQGRPAPLGVPGEIHIGGAQVARGYLHRPALSAERFVADPFSPEADARMYRSGDLGCWLPDGQIAYLGRNDHQVKIRGFRIELGEIEARLLACDGVREAVVLAREDVPGDKRLVAYLVAQPGVPLAISAVREQLQRQLAEHMVPGALVVLPALPLTPNGKLDRRALPAPDASARVQRGHEAPQGELEFTLAQLWAEVLGLPAVGRHDNFFELGGHSLLAVSLVERLRQAGLATDVRTLFANPSVAGLAQALGSGHAQVPVPPNLIPARAARIVPEMLSLVQLAQHEIDALVAQVPGGAANVQDIYPLTPAQEGILFHHMVAPDGDPYVQDDVYVFASQALARRFVRTLQRVVDRHDVLRTAVFWENLREPVQVVCRQAPLALDELVLQGSAAGFARQVHAHLAARGQAFSLQQAPMLRLHLAEDPAQGRWLLHLISHHLLIDHTTIAVLVEEADLIDQGREAELPRPAPFRDFVAQTRLGVSAQAHEAFFRDMLADIDEPTAPFGLLDVQGDGRNVEEFRCRLPQPLALALRQQARRAGVSAASLMHLAWALVVARASGRREVVFGTVLFGRMQGGEQIDRMLGMLINTLPVRVSVDGLGVAAALRRTHQLLTGLLRHEHASLALAQRCSGVAAPAPLFSALLNFRYTPDETFEAPRGERLFGDIVDLDGLERTNYPLTFAIDDLGDDFMLTAQVSTPVSPQRVCAFMQRAIAVLVQALADHPEQPLHTLDVLPPDERALLLQHAGQASAPPQAPARSLCVHQRFEAVAARQPLAPALRHGDVLLSYGELNARANHLARQVARLGVGPNTRVAVVLPRGVPLVVALLAVHKAGGAYVPLDPSYPPERLSYMLGSCAPRVVLAAGDSLALARRVAADAAAAADDGMAVLDLQADLPALADGSDNLHTHADATQHLAYLIYTSGSTGLPKPAQVRHGGLANLLDWYVEDCGLQPDEHVLLLSSHSFDLTQKNIFGPLVVGGCLHLGVEPFEPRRILDQIRDEGITWLNVAPSAFGALIDCEARALQPLRCVVLGGEPIHAAALAQIPEPRPRFVNSYGPTECSDVVAWHALDARLEIYAHGVPLGRPIRDTRLYLLDDQHLLVPAGAVGEIFIGGVCVGAGYLNQPAMTAERFVADPFSGQPGSRMYKTGDLGRWLADGTLEYLGRNDHQVKIRGFRVELGEIEAQLERCPGVAEAVVVARELSGHQGRQLVAYVQALEQQVVDVQALRAHASAQLPAYMVPAAFVVLAHFPLTPNGKLDRAALPAPDSEAFAQRGYEAPQGDTEQTLATLWAELLGVPQVGRHDNFFALGGHSLLAVSLIERMRQAGLQADVRALFAAGSLAELAQAVGGESRAVVVPPNLIPAGAAEIRPEMLTLLSLDQAQIDVIVAQVPGGAANVQDIYPLAPLQEGILFHHLMAEQGDPYLLPSLYGFASREALMQLVEALQGVVDRHDILRTAVVWKALAQPVQVVCRQVRLPVEELRFDAAAGDIATQMQARLDPAGLRIPVHQAPLLRLHIAHDPAHGNGQGRWLLHVLAHHLALDHTTLDLVIAEARFIGQGRQAELAEPLPFRNFVTQARLGVSQAEHEAFFTELLGDIDEPTAPFGLLDVQGDGRGMAEADMVLPPELALGVRQHARRLGISAASLMHLAWGLVLAQASGREQVVFGTVMFGRMQGGEHADRVMGMFINTLPIRLGLGGQTLRQALRHTHQLLARLLRHEHAPLALAQRCSSVAAPAPLFSALLNYRHSPGMTEGQGETRGDAPGDGAAIEVLGGREHTNYPLCLDVDDLGEG